MRPKPTDWRGAISVRNIKAKNHKSSHINAKVAGAGARRPRPCSASAPTFRPHPLDAHPSTLHSGWRAANRDSPHAGEACRDEGPSHDGNGVCVRQLGHTTQELKEAPCLDVGRLRMPSLGASGARGAVICNECPQGPLQSITNEPMSPRRRCARPKPEKKTNSLLYPTVRLQGGQCLSQGRPQA